VAPACGPSPRRAQPEQAAQRHQLFVLFVDLAGELAILLWNVAAHRVLQVGHDGWTPDMAFAAEAEGVFAAHVQRVAVDRALEKASWWRATVSVAISASPTPSTCVEVPVK
jgi:predicted signal transduction protein with EAL and GGDEF domain